jgi:hypothetical protein
MRKSRFTEQQIVAIVRASEREARRGSASGDFEGDPDSVRTGAGDEDYERGRIEAGTQAMQRRTSVPTTESALCTRGCRQSGVPRPSPEATRASGETFPVSCPFKCPRMPTDARLFLGQLLAVLRNTLRDIRFVLAAVRVS